MGERETEALLSEALDLCVRGRRLDEMTEAALENHMRGDGPHRRVASMTIPLWVEDQYRRDIEAWEAKARRALARPGGER